MLGRVAWELRSSHGHRLPDNIRERSQSACYFGGGIGHLANQILKRCRREGRGDGVPPMQDDGDLPAFLAPEL